MPIGAWPRDDRLDFKAKDFGGVRRLARLGKGARGNIPEQFSISGSRFRDLID